MEYGVHEVVSAALGDADLSTFNKSSPAVEVAGADNNIPVPPVDKQAPKACDVSWPPGLITTLHRLLLLCLLFAQENFFFKNSHTADILKSINGIMVLHNVISTDQHVMASRIGESHDDTADCGIISRDVEITVTVTSVNYLFHGVIYQDPL